MKSKLTHLILALLIASLLLKIMHFKWGELAFIIMLSITSIYSIINYKNNFLGVILNKIKELN